MSYFWTAFTAFTAGIITCKFWTRWRNAAEAKLKTKL